MYTHFKMCSLVRLSPFVFVFSHLYNTFFCYFPCVSLLFFSLITNAYVVNHQPICLIILFALFIVRYHSTNHKSHHPKPKNVLFFIYRINHRVSFGPFLAIRLSISSSPSPSLVVSVLLQLNWPRVVHEAAPSAVCHLLVKQTNFLLKHISTLALIS